jgi:hypothetical protein
MRNVDHRVVVGYLVPINRSERFKIVFKEDTKQVYHYDFFKKEVKRLLEKMNPGFSFKDSEYECIPRFRYVEKEETLYFPDNFEMSHMVESTILRDLGLNEKIHILKIKETIGERLRELERFKISRYVIPA